MKILGNIIDCKSLEISQENFYDGVSFSKVTGLHCSDGNFAIKRIHKMHQNKLFRRELKVLFEKNVNGGPAS